MIIGHQLTPSRIFFFVVLNVEYEIEVKHVWCNFQEQVDTYFSSNFNFCCVYSSHHVRLVNFDEWPTISSNNEKHKSCEPDYLVFLVAGNHPFEYSIRKTMVYSVSNGTYGFIIKPYRPQTVCPVMGDKIDKKPVC